MTVNPCGKTLTAPLLANDAKHRENIQKNGPSLSRPGPPQITSSVGYSSMLAPSALARSSTRLRTWGSVMR